ncbi:hypothetical protein MYX78_06675 [Acidobacteria bacterium AH-259-G07]|nr:hypothetical protein [Acidobacteria bacterium AH-259-G07]
MKYLPFLVLLLQPVAVFSQQRPLVTEHAQTVKRGYLLLDIGVEFLQDAVFPFSGLEGDLTRTGVFGVRMGAGEDVEIQVLGTIQNVLNVENRFMGPNTPRLDFSGNSTSDVGDFSLATKVRLKEENGGWPALGFRFGVELPNASNEDGLGNDETNVFGSLLLQKQFGKLKFLTNLGVAILGDPVVAGSQDDLFTYGVALIYPVHPQVNLLADAYGRAGAGGVGTEEQSLLRLGSQIKAAGLYWDVALFLGFRDDDPSSGLILGVSKELRFPLFGK